TKPFSYQELLARIRALRRTRRRPHFGRLRVGGLELDPASRQVWLHGEAVALSKKEFALLRALAAEPTRVFTREELLRGVWGFQSMGKRLRVRNLVPWGYRFEGQVCALASVLHPKVRRSRGGGGLRRK